MAGPTIEQRLAVVECEIAELKQRLERLEQLIDRSSKDDYEKR